MFTSFRQLSNSLPLRNLSLLVGCVAASWMMTPLAVCEPPAGVDDGLRQAYERAVYSVEDSKDGTYRGVNPKQRLSAEFSRAGTRLMHAGGQASLQMTGFGYGDRLERPAAVQPVASGNRVEYRRGAFSEWYVNESHGLEQGFTLAQRVSVAGPGEPLVIAFSVGGGLRPELTAEGDAVVLKSGATPVLRYAGLRSWDARGRAVPSRMEVRDHEIRLVIDDRNAEYPLVVDPVWSQQAELNSSDGMEFDDFGKSVSISGDTAVVGADRDFGNNPPPGVAYVFVRSGTTWSQQQELTASDGASGDAFGTSVSISGDTVVIGAPNATVDGNVFQGAVYVFVRSGTTWSQQQKLSIDGPSGFGLSVGVSGDTTVIGTGSQAFVYVRSGTTWSLQQELMATDAAGGDNFGHSVAIDGDTVVVGAFAKTIGGNSDEGAAYVFVRSGTTWTQQQELNSSDGAAEDRFGQVVVINGDTAVIGAFDHQVGANAGQGAAYVFVRSGTTWTQQQELTSSDGAAGDNFGSAVAVSGNTAAIGAGFKTIGMNSFQGAAYVFVRSGTTWSQQQELNIPDPTGEDFFGYSVAIDGNTIVVGALEHNVGANSEQGSAYVFVQSAPGLSVTKSHTGNFTQGQTGATYTITVTNSGSASTTGTVTVVDTLPTGLTATAISGTGWTCTLGTLTCTSTTVEAAGASFPAITLTVNVAANAPASVTNSAAASGGGATGTATANDPTTVNASGAPALSITKSHTGSFTQGQTGATYTITVTNSGTASTTGTVTVVDTLPTGLTATAISGTGWTCTLGTLTCTSTTVEAAGASFPAITLTVNVAANAPASVTNSAAASGGGATGTSTANDPTTVNASGAPALSITKSHTGNFTQGQTGATYTITVTNSGSASTTGTVTVVDTLPTGLTATAISGTGWTCTLGTLTCTSTTVEAAGASFPAITLTVNVAANAPASVTNSAAASGGGATGTSTANDPTTVNASGAPALSITKSHTGNFTQGQTGATYAITVTNSGTASTTGTVTVVDTLPTGLTATAISGTGWTCTLGTLTCTSTTVEAAGASFPAITLTVNVAANAPASVTNSAAASGGGATGTSTANDPTTVNASGAPALSITKSHSGSFTQGQTGATYTITVTNSGSASTTGTVTVVDTLPTGLTATAISGTGWTCTLGTLTCTSTTVEAAGASFPAITLTVNVAANAPASVTNSAAASGGGATGTSTANDPTTVKASGAPALSITKSHSGSFTQGQTGATYTITVTNSGTASTSGTVTVVDTLPTGLTATAMSGTGWTCTLGTLTCTSTTVEAAGASFPAITLTVNVAANAPASVTNSAAASGGGATGTATANDPTTITPVGPPPAVTDAFQVRYAANLNIGDASVDITNSGASGGNICANVYTFDPAEELISCCTCSVTPNGLQSLSVLKSLISNPLTPAVPSGAVIKLVATTGACNAAVITADNLAPGMLAWGTSLHAQPTSPLSYGVTETPFSVAPLSAAELAHITSTCGFIQSDGSGFGICKGCAAGGLGAPTSVQ